MRVSRLDDGGYSMQLNEQELGVLWATLREAFATISREDFPLRVGCELAVASKIANELHALLQQADFPE